MLRNAPPPRVLAALILKVASKEISQTTAKGILKGLIWYYAYLNTQSRA